MCDARPESWRSHICTVQQRQQWLVDHIVVVPRKIKDNVEDHARRMRCSMCVRYAAFFPSADGHWDGRCLDVWHKSKPDSKGKKYMLNKAVTNSSNLFQSVWFCCVFVVVSVLKWPTTSHRAWAHIAFCTTSVLQFFFSYSLLSLCSVDRRAICFGHVWLRCVQQLHDILFDWMRTPWLLMFGQFVRTVGPLTFGSAVCRYSEIIKMRPLSTFYWNCNVYTVHVHCTVRCVETQKATEQHLTHTHIIIFFYVARYSVRVFDIFGRYPSMTREPSIRITLWPT